MSHRCQSVLRDRRGRKLADIASVSADFPNGHVIPEHSHPEDQLLYASKGVMTLRTMQGVWVIPPMRAIWIPADVAHSVSMSGQVSMRTLYLLPKLCRSFPKCFVMNVSGLLRELILHACKFSKLNRAAAQEKRIIDILRDQLKSVESVPLQLPHPSDSRAQRVAEILFTEPADPRTLDQLCRHCGASKRTIQRLFLTETKMSFAKWRQQLRLLHAMQLLGAGEKVMAAALESGYESTSAFIAMFRKHLGTTPMQYWGDGESRVA